MLSQIIDLISGIKEFSSLQEVYDFAVEVNRTESHAYMAVYETADPLAFQIVLYNGHLLDEGFSSNNARIWHGFFHK